MTSISDILLRLAKGIKSSGIDASCQSLFKKDMKFVVGGYAQNIVGENDAPFCLVMAENTESNVNTKDILSFNAKVIIGISPLRDVPSTDDADRDISSTIVILDLIIPLINELKALFSHDEDVAFCEETITSLTNAKAAFLNEVSAISSAKESSDYETIISKYEASVQRVSSYMQIVEGLLNHQWEQLEPGTPAALKLNQIYDVWEEYCSILYPQFQSSVSAVKSNYESYIDDPYIQSATVDGITIFGAQNIMDKMREKVVAAIYDIDVGMILDAVKVNCNSVSHYPLDWSEITVELSLPDVMNTASMSD